MPLRLAGEDLDDIRVRLYGHDGKPLLLGGPAGNQLQVVAVNPDGTTIGGSHTDDAPFTPASDDGSVAFAVADDTAPDSVDEGDAGAVRMSLDRILYVRLHAIEQATLLASALRTAGVSSPNQTNRSAKGVLLHFDVSARTVGAAPNLRLRIHIPDPIGTSSPILAMTSYFDPTIGGHLVVCYPGASGSMTEGRGTFSLLLPQSWFVLIDHGADITNITYSLAATYIY